MYRCPWTSVLSTVQLLVGSLITSVSSDRCHTPPRWSLTSLNYFGSVDLVGKERTTEGGAYRVTGSDPKTGSQFPTWYSCVDEQRFRTPTCVCTCVGNRRGSGGNRTGDISAGDGVHSSLDVPVSGVSRKQINEVFPKFCRPQNKIDLSPK